MAERLMELKEKRENERQALVQGLNEKRFRETTDDLRREDAQFFTKQCAIERDEQMREKRARMDQELMEEQIYSALWNQDMRQKQERERKEKQEQERMKKDTLDVLNWQTNQNRHKKGREDAMRRTEQNMLQQHYKIEDEKAQQLQQQQLLLNKERNLEIIRHNQMEKDIANQEAERERQRDRDMIHNAVAHENHLAKIEHDEKEARRQEAKDLQEYYKSMKSDKEAEE